MKKQGNTWITCVGLMMVLLVSCGTENEPFYTLTTTVTPKGFGTIEPASGEYTEGEVVTITASTSLEGWQFKQWAGDWTDISNPTTITMTKDYSVIGLFEEEPWSRDTTTQVLHVLNSVTGLTWMDRNLGAIHAATSSTDLEAFGDLYQWGRSADGHEKRTSGTRNTLSYSDQPGHGDFIFTGVNSPYDWRSPQNDNLWQGVGGENNPCPFGYRLPTEAEWNSERQSWSSDNSAGAYGSPLKLSVAGLRGLVNGSIFNVGSYGRYWSSSVDGVLVRSLYFNSNNASMRSLNRADGYSVRCLKD